jgi:hypothetical protein
MLPILMVLQTFFSLRAAVSRRYTIASNYYIHYDIKRHGYFKKMSKLMPICAGGLLHGVPAAAGNSTTIM